MRKFSKVITDPSEKAKSNAHSWATVRCQGSRNRRQALPKALGREEERAEQTWGLAACCWGLAGHLGRG